MEMQTYKKLANKKHFISCFSFPCLVLEARSHQSLKNNITTFWIDQTVTWPPLAFKMCSCVVSNRGLLYMISALQHTVATTLKITPFNCQSHLLETGWKWHFSQFILQPYAVCEKLITRLLQKVSRSSFHGTSIALGWSLEIQMSAAKHWAAEEEKKKRKKKKRYLLVRLEGFSVGKVKTQTVKIFGKGYRRMRPLQDFRHFSLKSPLPVPPDRSLFTVNTKRIK